METFFAACKFFVKIPKKISNNFFEKWNSVNFDNRNLQSFRKMHENCIYFLQGASKIFQKTSMQKSCCIEYEILHAFSQML